MADNFSDVNPNLENVDYNIKDVYENKFLRKEKKCCLFCGKKAVKVIRNINSDHSQSFILIRHCNSDECRKLAIIICNKYLKSLIT